MSVTTPPGAAVSRPRLSFGAVREYGIVLALIVLVLAACVGVDKFATTSNLTEVLRSVSLTGIVAVGMTLIVISGNMVDLSIPGMVALSGILALSLQSLGAVPAVVIALLAALGIGLLNGLLIGYLDGNPVIVTLGIGSVVAGVVLTATGGAYYYGSSEGLRDIGRAEILGVPIQVVFFLVAVIAGQLLLTRSRLGFGLRSVGANRMAARLSGIRDRTYVTFTFMLAALCAGVAGILLAINADSVNASVGTGYEFQALTAVVVGGCSLFGGSGSVWRTFVGAVFVGVLNNAMILLGLPFPVQQILQGALIAGAVGLDVWMRNRTWGTGVARA